MLPGSRIYALQRGYCPDHKAGSLGQWRKSYHDITTKTCCVKYAWFPNSQWYLQAFPTGACLHDKLQSMVGLPWMNAWTPSTSLCDTWSPTSQWYLWLCDCPSHANSKTAVLLQYLMGCWWGLLKCNANSARRYSLPLASYPGLLDPVFVACSTNAGEGLVKLSHVVWRTWTCGWVAPSRKNNK